MSTTWQGHGYRIGTRVQHKTGYIYVKVQSDEGEVKMMAESRRIWELYHGPLGEGDRVFHVNGDRTDNNIANLSKIHFNQTKFTINLKSSRILRSWGDVWGTGRKPAVATKSSLVLPEFKAKPSRALVAA